MPSDTKLSAKSIAAIAVCVVMAVAALVPTCSFVSENSLSREESAARITGAQSQPSISLVKAKGLGLSYDVPDGWNASSPSDSTVQYTSPNGEDRLTLNRTDLSDVYYSFEESNPGRGSAVLLSTLASEMDAYDGAYDQSAESIGGNEALSFKYMLTSGPSQCSAALIDLGMGDVVLVNAAWKMKDTLEDLETYDDMFEKVCESVRSV